MENYIPIISIIVTIFFTLVNLFITIKYSSFNKVNSQKLQLLAKRDDISKIISLSNELWHFEAYMQDSESSQLHDIEKREDLILKLSRLTTQFYVKNMRFTYVDPTSPIDDVYDLVADLRSEALDIDEELKNRLIEIDKKLLTK